MNVFKVASDCHPEIGNAGIQIEDRNKYYAQLCFRTEPNKDLERGTAFYFCDLQLSKEQLKELIEKAEKFLELNP